MKGKGKSMGLLLGLGKPSDEPMPMGEEMGEESEGSDAEMAAAQDLLDAVSSGDASAVKAALRASYDACAGKSMVESDDDYP